jgi:putative hydrolase of the HAD superfamily
MDSNRLITGPTLPDAPVVLALDVDGVLLDSSRGGAGSWQATLADRFGIAPDDLRDVFFARHWNDVVTGRAAIRPLLRDALVEMGSTVSADVVLTHWLASDFVVDDPAVEAAGCWARTGVPIVLATNQEHERAAYLAARLGRLLPLSGVAYSAALGVTKDDPAFYPLAHRHLGLAAAATVVFVDDSVENVQAAEAAGWRSVWCAGDGAWCAEVDAILADHAASHR